MTRPFMAGTICAALLSLSAGGAAAQDCKNPQMLSSIGLTPIAGDNRMLVPVTINGEAKNLLLDTAGGRTTLTQASVDALHLHSTYNSQVRLLDADGNASHNFVAIDSLVLSNLRSKTQLMVTPDPNAGTNPAYDGVFAADLMSRYDVEVDFASHRLNYFSPDHCAGRVIYWPTSAIGVVPISLFNFASDAPRSGQAVSHHLLTGTGGLSDTQFQTDGATLTGLEIRTHVTIDGKDFTATINTGSPITTMSADVAKALFDVTGDDAGFEHDFHTLSFGDVTVISPHFTIRPTRVGEKDRDNNFRIGSHIERVDDNVAPDVHIGMNVLRKLHLYFAFKEGKLYLTPGLMPIGQPAKS